MIPTARIVVGGPFNRWLNISRVELVRGAEDPDSKIFMCEVCVDRETPSQVCHTANYTNLVTGGPPRIKETRSKNLRTSTSWALIIFGGVGLDA